MSREARAVLAGLVVALLIYQAGTPLGVSGALGIVLGVILYAAWPRIGGRYTREDRRHTLGRRR